MKHIILFCFASLLFFTCNLDEEPLSLDMGPEYYPLNIGSYKIYDVEDTQYELDGDIWENNYQIIESVEDVFSNAGADSTYIIYRYWRPDENSPWEFLQTRKVKKTANTLVVSEGNIPYVKLSFPFSAGRTWDGNVLNNFERDEYLMDSLHRPFKGKYLQFDSTVTVVHNDSEDFIVQLDRRYELYSFKLGMVYKEETIFNYCVEDICIGQQKINTGRKYKESLMEYGQL